MEETGPRLSTYDPVRRRSAAEVHAMAGTSQAMVFVGIETTTAAGVMTLIDAVLIIYVATRS